MGKCIVVAGFGQGKTKISAYRKEEGKLILFSGAVFDTPAGGFAEPELLQMFAVHLEKLDVKSGVLYALLPVDEKNVIAGEADYPMGTAKDVASIIKNNISNFIPEDADQFNYDWRLMEGYPSGHGHFQVAAVRNSDMDIMHDIAERKHLNLVYADLNSNAIEMLARQLRKDKKYGLNTAEDAIALVDVGHRGAKIIVLSKDRIIRNVSVTHDFYRMDKIIMGTLGDLKNDKAVIPELLKLNPSYTHNVSQYPAFLESATAEIVRNIKQSVSGENRYRLNTIFFTGGLYKMPQLVSKVKESFDVPCFAFPMSDFVLIKDNCIVHEAKKATPTADIFAASIGALMGGK